MVFSSVPVYLDPPPNWQQQANNYHHHHHHQHQQGVNISGNDQNHPHHQLPPPAPQPAASGGSGGSIRPGSMADRARAAKIPQPEVALKCPRCDSTNTKFCYFNNYNLSQPRHFCKTCRRYWTKGGALRNVPVGGGCRRNKKTKSNPSTSKSSPVSSSERLMGSNSEMVGHFPQQAPQFPHLGSLHNLTQYGLGNLGLNFSHSDMGTSFNIGSSSTSGTTRVGGVQQFPFFDSPAATNLFPFQTHEGAEQGSSTRHDPMKAEETPISTRSFAVNVNPENNNQYWGGSNWTDLSNVSSSTTYNLL